MSENDTPAETTIEGVSDPGAAPDANQAPVPNTDPETMSVQPPTDDPASVATDAPTEDATDQAGTVAAVPDEPVGNSSPEEDDAPGDAGTDPQEDDLAGADDVPVGDDQPATEPPPGNPSEG